MEHGKIEKMERDALEIINSKKFSLMNPESIRSFIIEYDGKHSCVRFHTKKNGQGMWRCDQSHFKYDLICPCVIVSESLPS